MDTFSTEFVLLSLNLGLKHFFFQFLRNQKRKSVITNNFFTHVTVFFHKLIGDQPLIHLKRTAFSKRNVGFLVNFFIFLHHITYFTENIKLSQRKLKKNPNVSENTTSLKKAQVWDLYNRIKFHGCFVVELPLLYTCFGSKAVMQFCHGRNTHVSFISFSRA